MKPTLKLWLAAVAAVLAASWNSDGAVREVPPYSVSTYLDGFAQSDFSSLAAFCQALIASAQSEVLQLLDTEQVPLPETKIGGPLAVLDNFVRYCQDRGKNPQITG